MVVTDWVVTADHAAVMSILEFTVVSMVTALAVMANEHSGAMPVNAAEKHTEAKHSMLPDAPVVRIVQLACALHGKLVEATATAGTVTEATVVAPHFTFAVTVEALRFGTVNTPLQLS